MALDRVLSGVRSLVGKNDRSGTKKTGSTRNLTKELKTRNYEQGKELLSPGNNATTAGGTQGETGGETEAPEAGPLSRAAFLRQLLGGVEMFLSDDQVVLMAMGRGWITQARPTDAITRAEAAVILCRANNIQPLAVTEIKHTFKDLPATHWAATYVYALAFNGVLHGYADETFKPDDVLEDAVVAGLMERAKNPPGLDANGFDPTREPPRQTEFPVKPEPASDSKQDVAAYIHDNFPNGIPIALYNNVEESEFKDQAVNWATREKAVTVASGVPKLGLAVPLTGMDTGVLAGLVNEIATGIKQFMDQVDAEFHTGYNYPSQNIDRIAIFTHGYMNENNTGGLRVGSSRLTSDELYTDPDANLPENQQGFINRIQASLSGSVRIMMYSCSVGRNSNETSEYTAAETDGGDQSFAATLRDGLADAGKGDSEVWAHSFRGHTTKQPAIRRFRASERGQNGEAYFNLVFPEDFINEQVTKMQQAKAAGTLKNFTGTVNYSRVRAAMHSFYITQSYQPRDGHDEYAELIPLYPEIVMNRLQDEWMTRVGTTPQ